MKALISESDNRIKVSEFSIFITESTKYMKINAANAD